MLKAKSQQHSEVVKKNQKLEERLMNDEIEASTFKTWFQKYSSEKALLAKEMAGLKQNGSDVWKRFNTLVPALTNLSVVYEKANLNAKGKLVKAVFKHNLSYAEGGI